DRFAVGRTDGDLVLPHDPQVSGRHAELARQQDENGAWVWVLTDLGSTNGTFVRAGSALLKDGQEFLVGRTRYRFDAPRPDAVPPPAADAPGSPARAGVPVSWNVSGEQLVPTLLELTPHGPGARVPLLQAEYWIGSDPACAVVPLDDPYVSPRHARVSRDAKG